MPGKSSPLGIALWVRADLEPIIISPFPCFSKSKLAFCSTPAYPWFILRCPFGKKSKITFVVQSLSRIWLFATPVDCSTSDFAVLHHLPEFAQTHVHRIGGAIHPSHPLLPPSPPAVKSRPASGSFPVSRLFISGGQSSGASASASVLPMNVQDWFPLGLTGLISW